MSKKPKKKELQMLDALLKENTISLFNSYLTIIRLRQGSVFHDDRTWNEYIDKDTHYYCGVYYAPETRTYIVVEEDAYIAIPSSDTLKSIAYSLAALDGYEMSPYEYLLQTISANRDTFIYLRKWLNDDPHTLKEPGSVHIGLDIITDIPDINKHLADAKVHAYLPVLLGWDRSFKTMHSSCLIKDGRTFTVSFEVGKEPIEVENGNFDSYAMQERVNEIMSMDIEQIKC
jgi:hypothetical protein